MNKETIKIPAVIYNYSTNDTKTVMFPMTEENINKLLAEGEVMVDASSILPVVGDYGCNIRQFNEWAEKISEAGLSKLQLMILGQAYFTEEIVEKIDKDEIPNIIDFDEETSDWISSDFYSEEIKGRLLYELGYAAFPVAVPDELVEYMDYAMLWRDTSINMNIRCVTYSNKHYLVF